ncbi:MAG: thiamine phosphate synthase [Planctomycetota bacterium]
MSSELVMAWRVVDANANRAMEGLRTLEDVARLGREDETVARWLKPIRHELANILQSQDRSARLESRSTEGDAGTEITERFEAARGKLNAIVSAAAERTTQALRQLEEFGKLIDSEMGARFKQLRYTAYDVLAKAELRLVSDGMAKFLAPSLYLLMDCKKSLPEFCEYVAKLAAAGVDWIQIRDKQSDAAQLVEYGRAAKESLKSTSCGLVINDRIDVAIACRADAVHLGQEDLSLSDARRMVPASMAIGISTHNVEQAVEAEQGGADYIGCGPTFPSQTKQFEDFAGTEFLAEAASAVSLPYFAIGGIDAKNVGQIVAAGCRRIAVSGAVHGAKDPAAAVRELKVGLGSGSGEESGAGEKDLPSRAPHHAN